MQTETKLDAQEGKRFLNKVLAIAAPFLEHHQLQQTGPVLYWGVDPKGAGRLFAAFFVGPAFQLKVSTSDGAAEVKVSSVGTPLDPNIGWIWPSQAAAVLGSSGASASDLVALQQSLSDAHVGWV